MNRTWRALDIFKSVMENDIFDEERGRNVREESTSVEHVHDQILGISSVVQWKPLTRVIWSGRNALAPHTTTEHCPQLLHHLC